MPEIKLEIDDPGRVEVTPVDDDQTSRYLLSRQVSHEYHAPAVQELVKADIAERQVRQQAALTEMDQFKKDQAKKKAEETGRVEDFTAGLLSDLETRKPDATSSIGSRGAAPVAKEGGGGGWGDAAPEALPSVAAESKAEAGGIEAPMVDPVMAASAGAGAAGFMTFTKLHKFVPSLAAAVRAGVVNAAMEPVYGTAAEVVGANNPALALPFNVLVGVAGGMGFEPIFERAIARASAKIGKAIDPALMKSILANESGMVEAWHGSPYKFDKMSTEKIGTGEGAQAFGHGLYFTDKQSIAKMYKEQLSGPPEIVNWKIKDIPLYQRSTPINYSPKTNNEIDITRSILQENLFIEENTIRNAYAKSPDEGLKEIQRIFDDTIDYMKDEYSKTSVDFVKKRRPETLKDIQFKTNDTGALYRAQLFPGKDPSEYTFLDWYDKISEQPKFMEIAQKGNEKYKAIKNEIAELKDVPENDAKYDQLMQELNHFAVFPDIVKRPDKYDGNQVYYALTGGDRNAASGKSKEASLFLKSVGIDGIRYPTETLSGKGPKGGDAFNYVVFDDKDVKLVSRESGGVVESLEPTTYKITGKVESVKPGELGKGIETNKAVEDYKKKIVSTGKVMPIEVDERGFIVDGEHRYKAMLELGIEEIPVYVGKQSGSSGRLQKAYPGLSVDVKINNGGVVDDLTKKPYADMTQAEIKALTPDQQADRILSTFPEDALRNSYLKADDAGKAEMRDTLIRVRRAVIEEVNTEVKNMSVADILKSQKGELVVRQGTEVQPTPRGNLGIPAPPDMQKAGQQFLANTNPDITTEMAGKSNIRLWSGGADLTPKWMDDVNSPEDLMRVTTAMADTFPEQIQVARRGTRSHAVTEAAAEGMTLEQALGRKGAQALNAEQTVNLQNHTVASISALQEMKTIMNSGAATPLNELDFMKTFNMSYALINQYAGNAAEVGRALEIHKRIKQATGLKIGELKDFMNSLTGLEPAEIAARMADMTNIGQMKQFILQGHRATTVNMWNEAYINGMLWLPTTHMANTVSNALTDVMNVGERYIAAGISQSPIGSGAISFREAQAYAYGMAQATGDAWRTFAKTVQTGEPSDAMTKLDLSGQGRKAITGENVAYNIDRLKQRFGNKANVVDGKLPPFEFDQASPFKRFIDVAGEITRTPGRFLLAEDDAFKTLAYRGELHALSYRKAMAEFENNLPDAEAYLAKKGIDTTGMNEEKVVRTAMGNRIAEIIDDPGKHASEVQIGAKDQARYLTYTSPIDNKIVNAIRTSQNPFLKMLIPFTGTPYNIFRYTTERTPLFGFALKSMREDFNAGGARRDLALAKQAIGTMVWGSAVGMVVASGEDSPARVYGYGPREPNRRKAWLRDGHKPYSFEFGDTIVEYGRMEPFASVFGIAVDGAEILGIADPKLAPETDKIFPAFMAATAQGYMSKTFLQGVAGGVQAFYEADANKMQKLINNYGKSAVPFSSAIRGAEQAISPQRKAVDGLFEAIQSEIPYFSDKLPVQVDLWNRPLSKEMEKNESYLQTAARVVSPIYITKRQDSPIDKELWKNFKEGIPMPQREQHFKGEGMKSIPYELNTRQYATFIKYMNDEPLQSTDMKLKPSLDYMVKNDENYKNLTDPADKMKMIRGKLTEAVTMARKKMYETDAVIKEVVDTLQAESLNRP